MKQSILILAGLWALLACGPTSAPEQADTADTPPAAPTRLAPDLRPLMLDAVQYYVTDPAGFDEIFRQYLHAGMPAQASPALPFLRLYQFRPQQPTLQFAPPGPWPGLEEREDLNWERQQVAPGPETKYYGVYWVALRTRSLDGTLSDLAPAGVQWLSQQYVLPQEPTARAALTWGPDYTQLVFVERAGDRGATPYALDHLMLLVSSVTDNVAFFRDALGAEVQTQTAHLALVVAGGIPLVLAEPEALGLKRHILRRPDPEIFRPGIEQLVFLYQAVEPVADHLREAGFPLPVAPTQLQYAGQATPYTLAQTLTPDSLPILLIEESGRTGAREMPPPDEEG